jgi:uncharacterized protein YxjI
MNLTETANLIYTDITQDADGFNIETPVKTGVLVDKKDVFDNLKFASMASGAEAKIMFELWEDDFKLTEHASEGKKLYADRVEYDGETYKILNRSTADNSLIIRLTCG